jgi:SSS family solute:Na+ symporter
VWTTATGFWFSRSTETVIELVNRVGSLVYGPMLALFLLCWRSRRADQTSAVLGALAGVGANALLAWLVPSVSWLWWNVFGCGVTVLLGIGLGRNRLGTSPVPSLAGGRRLPRVLVIEFGAILGLLLLLTWASRFGAVR